MRTTNVTSLRKDLFNSIDQVIDYNESITVNSKKGNVVILSEDDYFSMIETIYLISQPDIVKKIKKGELEDISKMSKYKPDEEW